MATVTFDTLELVEKLKASGLPQAQADAVVRAIAASQTELVTKVDLEIALKNELAPIKTDIAVLKWMVGFVAAGVVSLVAKAFLA